MTSALIQTAKDFASRAPPQLTTPTSLTITSLCVAASLALLYSRRKPQRVDRYDPDHDASTSIMSPEKKDLAEPLETEYTPEELSVYNGETEEKPIYLAIKGTVFDVTAKREMYRPGASYNIFAGKDGSRGLGMSSLTPENAVADWSTLDEKERKVLEDWYTYYKKRYNVVGRVVTLSSSSS